MTRVKRGKNARRRRHKKFQITKGFRGASSLLFKNANQQFLKCLKTAFVDRRLRKRFFRSIWISRINAKVRQFGLNYHSFAYKNKKINRKIFAQLALYDRLFFNNLHFY
uniref:50S ribosomal protein L20 n=1 Tax=Udotea flabellum TaxID=170437 RepID=A0A386B1U8_9CHLO|nr:ribosomal protein L20 [Udotea flabellum]AYC65684.1 ribosomal protein L20 [Udotea flabellum]